MDVTTKSVFPEPVAKIAYGDSGIRLAILLRGESPNLAKVSARRRAHARHATMNYELYHVANMEATAGSSFGPSSGKKPRQTTQERRRFVPQWTREYPWAFLNESGDMQCRYCLDARKQRFALRKHVATADHRSALMAKNGRRDMQRAVATANRSQEQAISFKPSRFKSGVRSKTA